MFLHLTPAGSPAADSANTWPYSKWNSLDYARESFRWLVTGPNPLALDGRDFPGLPQRQIPLDELLNRLLHRRCPPATRDAVWAELVRRSRMRGASWTVAAVGMAMPALLVIASRLTVHFTGDSREIHDEVLRGFLAHLAVIDIDRPWIMLRLRWAAYRSGRLALLEAVGRPSCKAPGFRSDPPPPPEGHPDLVLALAVADGVLTRTEADLIGTTRLEETPVADWAQAHGTKPKTAYKARDRAEDRLIGYLRQAQVDHDPTTDPVGCAAITATAFTHTDELVTTRPSSSLSVSGRRRNGRPIFVKKSSTLVSKNGPKSGFRGCGGTPPTTRVGVPRCA